LSPVIIATCLPVIGATVKMADKVPSGKSLHGALQEIEAFGALIFEAAQNFGVRLLAGQVNVNPKSSFGVVVTMVKLRLDRMKLHIPEPGRIGEISC
jgi:hypothetical protein